MRILSNSTDYPSSRINGLGATTQRKQACGKWRLLSWLLLLASCQLLVATPGWASPQAAGPKFTDAAEYQLYKNAHDETNPKAQAAAYEDFLKQFPDSSAKVYALRALVLAYRKQGDMAKADDAANRLEKAAANDLNALMEVASLKQQQVSQPKADKKSIDDAVQFAEHGLQTVKSVTKPAGMSDADFQKQKDKATTAMEGLLGSVAMKNKDFAGAQQHYQNAVNTSPDSLLDVYALAKAYLDASEPDYPKGLWYTARAAALATDPKMKANYSQGGKDRYIKYHGNDQGWAEVLKQAAANPAPPADLAELIKPGAETPKKSK
jgi:tetratricopeptide (TPR) repeat protein